MTQPIQQALIVCSGALAICACSEAHVEPPRPAVGCVDLGGALVLSYLTQGSVDGTSCVRLDFGRAEVGGISTVPGVAIEGDFGLVGAHRVSAVCGDVLPTYFRSHPSWVLAEEGSGIILTGPACVTRARADFQFPAAPDGSLGATTVSVSAQDVAISEPCPAGPEP